MVFNNTGIYRFIFSSSIYYISVDGNCPVDCEYYDWNAWSSCTVTCGGGVKLRSRLIKNQELYGGNPCNRTILDGIYTSTEKTECNVETCPPGMTYFI